CPIVARFCVTSSVRAPARAAASAASVPAWPTPTTITSNRFSSMGKKNPGNACAEQILVPSGPASQRLYLHSRTREDREPLTQQRTSLPGEIVFMLRACLAALLALAALPGFAASDPTELVLTDCRISAGPGYPGLKARCGRLTRPLDPAAPESPAIELAVAVVPALSLEPAPTPLVPIAGGPGQSTIEFFAAYAGAFEAIRRNRDIVLLDQRGTGDSAALDCPFDEAQGELEFTPERGREEARRCLNQLPHDPRFFTTSVAVTDLEALREALRVPAFDLYGISYGTRVAQHYARQYPETTRTVILDGVVPPQVALGPAIAIHAQGALDRIFGRCATSAGCNARFPGIAARFAGLKRRLADEPVTVELPHPVSARPETVSFGAAELAGALRMLSYHPSTVALMPLLIDEAWAGNYRPIAAQYLMTSRSIAEALSIGMHNAVVCTEDAPFFAYEN